jgi:nickel-dependent lactate racemase
MTRLAVDDLGGDVWINEAVVESERILAIGSIEPHYFAGFTGGRKSLFPGLTDLATIERNHNLANSLGAAPLKLRGNPVADHLEALIGLIAPERLFGVQTVLDVKRNLAEVSCGPLAAAFADACGVARRYYAAEVEQAYDLVVAEVRPPLDSSLYQVQKALENCQTAVRDGGAVMLVSACREGIGSPHFFAAAAGWDRDRNVPLDGVWRFGSHKLSRVNAIGKRIGVYLKSDLAPADVERVFYRALDNPSDFDFIGLSNAAGRAAVVHDAGNMVLSHKL